MFKTNLDLPTTLKVPEFKLTIKNLEFYVADKPWVDCLRDILTALYKAYGYNPEIYIENTESFEDICMPNKISKQKNVEQIGNAVALHAHPKGMTGPNAQPPAIDVEYLERDSNDQSNMKDMFSKNSETTKNGRAVAAVKEKLTVGSVKFVKKNCIKKMGLPGNAKSLDYRTKFSPKAKRIRKPRCPYTPS